MLKLIWARLQLAYRVLLWGLPPEHAKLDALLVSSFRDVAERAVAKVANDPSFHTTKDHLKKHAEAMEWAMTYLNGKASPAPWEVGFLVEWLIGVRKGRL